MVAAKVPAYWCYVSEEQSYVASAMKLRCLEHARLLTRCAADMESASWNCPLSVPAVDS